MLGRDFDVYNLKMGTAMAQWLRRCAKNRNVAGSIQDEIFH